MSTTTAQRVQVHEVHNFGGFFGGDTVTLTAHPWGGGEDQEYTIDQQALANVADRYTICAGMLLDLVFAGDRVEAATVRAAPSYDELRAALGPATAIAAPAVLAYHCPACALWIDGAPDGNTCTICGGILEA